MSTPPPVMPDGLKGILLKSFARPDEDDDLGLDPEKSGLSAFLDTLWPLYADKGRFALRLQYLYVQRDALDFLRRQTVDAVTFTEAGVSASLGQVEDGLAKMRADVQGDIEQLETQVQAGQVPASAAMMTLQIGSLPAWGANPADTRYLGDPLRGYRTGL